MKTTGGHLSDAGSVTLNAQIMNVTGQKPMSHQMNALKDANIGGVITEQVVPQRDISQQKKAVNREADVATHEALVSSSFPQEVVTIPEPQTVSAGGFFTRHLRRSAYRDSRYAVPYATSQDLRDSQRLALFSAQLVQVEGIECVLLGNSVECQKGYEMSMERQSEWRYLYEHQMMPNKISVKAEYLHQ